MRSFLRFPGYQTLRVIGGEGIYRLLLPYCDRAVITEFDAEFPADAISAEDPRPSRMGEGIGKRDVLAARTTPAPGNGMEDRDLHKQIAEEHCAVNPQYLRRFKASPRKTKTFLPRLPPKTRRKSVIRPHTPLRKELRGTSAIKHTLAWIRIQVLSITWRLPLTMCMTWK